VHDETTTVTFQLTNYSRYWLPSRNKWSK